MREIVKVFLIIASITALNAKGSKNLCISELKKDKPNLEIIKTECKKHAEFLNKKGIYDGAALSYALANLHKSVIKLKPKLSSVDDFLVVSYAYKKLAKDKESVDIIKNTCPTIEADYFSHKKEVPLNRLNSIIKLYPKDKKIVDKINRLCKLYINIKKQKIDKKTAQKNYIKCKQMLLQKNDYSNKEIYNICSSSINYLKESSDIYKQIEASAIALVINGIYPEKRVLFRGNQNDLEFLAIAEYAHLIEHIDARNLLKMGIYRAIKNYSPDKLVYQMQFLKKALSNNAIYPKESVKKLIAALDSKISVYNEFIAAVSCNLETIKKFKANKQVDSKLYNNLYNFNKHSSNLYNLTTNYLLPTIFEILPIRDFADICKESKDKIKKDGFIDSSGNKITKEQFINSIIQKIKNSKSDIPKSGYKQIKDDLLTLLNEFTVSSCKDIYKKYSSKKRQNIFLPKYNKALNNNSSLIKNSYIVSIYNYKKVCDFMYKSNQEAINLCLSTKIKELEQNKNNTSQESDKYKALSHLYIDIKNYKKALFYEKRLLNIYKKLYNPKDRRLAKRYYNIAFLYYKLLDYKQSIKSVKKALAIFNISDSAIDICNSMSLLKKIPNSKKVYSSYKKFNKFCKSAKLDNKKIDNIEPTLYAFNILDSLNSTKSCINLKDIIGKKEIDNLFKSAISLSLLLYGQNHINTGNYYYKYANFKTKIEDKYSYFLKANSVFNNIKNSQFLYMDQKQKIEFLNIQKKTIEYILKLSYQLSKEVAKVDKIDTLALKYRPNDETIGYLHNNQKLKILDKKGKWYKVKRVATKENVAIENRFEDAQAKKSGGLIIPKLTLNSIELEGWCLNRYIQLDKRYSQQAFNTWLNYKGSIFDSENTIATLYAITKDKKLKSKIEDLTNSKRDLAKLYQSVPKPKLRESWRKNIKKLEVKIDNLTKDIANRADSFKELQELKNISYKDISKNLKNKELYIDFAKTKNNYYIFTLDSKNGINFIKINKKESNEIDTLVKSFRADIEKIINSNLLKKDLDNLTVSSKEKLSKLYSIIFNPIKSILKDKSSLIISTDGALKLLPFEALYNKNSNKYLIEQKDIKYTPSGKELVRLYKFSNKKISKENIVIFANPNFNDKLVQKNSNSKNQLKRAAIVKSLFKMKFNELPGTKEEAEAIKTILKDKTKVKEFTKNSATEDNLLNVNKPKILHIATHGFFINDSSVPNPMLKAGIALSGANVSAKHLKGNGIVTALKLSGLNLKGTNLVVISACETGVVDINSTNSVSALGKAFIEAGAKDIVMSLWKVDDNATKDLMTSFYKEFTTKNKNYTKALKDAKLKMIKHNMHPYFWAPFVLSGL